MPTPIVSPPSFLTRHAVERCQLMGVTPAEVRAAVRNPEVVYPGEGGRRFHVAGLLAVVVAADGVVVTVLPRFVRRCDVTP